MLLLGFAESTNPARAVAEAAAIDYAEIDVHRFPDGESRLTLPTVPAEHVVIYRSLEHPNAKLLELFFASAALRETGVKRLSLIAPYLCYMRQDRAFHPGEVVSQKHVGRLLAQHFDDLMTVDPHLHRVSRLEEAVPVRHAVTLHATGVMAEFLQGYDKPPMLMGPDEESLQWVREIASLDGLDYGVARKLRRGDRKVEIELPDLDYRGRHLVLVDDVVSSGHTIATAARGLLQAGATSVDCLTTHALFAEGAEALLKDAGVTNIYSSDAIPHPSNRLSLARLLAAALKALPQEG